MMAIKVTTYDHSLGEYYKRFSGEIGADGTVTYFEYGEYPYPTTDENGNDSDASEFRVTVLNNGAQLDTESAVTLLKEVGVFDTEHVEFLKERFAGHDGIEVL